jgi:hypothetical protein
MSNPAADFERELEIFRGEAESAAQFFYSYLTVHAVAAEKDSVYQVLNRHALFWNTALAALQLGTFITLGRVFDQQSPHNVDRLLGLAQKNPGIFSKSALAQRKQGTAPAPPSWLPEYLKSAYVPKASDFRRLRKYVRDRRRLYEAKYRDLRHKVFAHKEVTEPDAVAALFAKTNIRELERTLALLGSLHEALWQLFFNGHRPSLRPRRYSVRRMRDLPSPASRRRGVQERITHEAEEFLTLAAGAAQLRITSDAPRAARR